MKEHPAVAAERKAHERFEKRIAKLAEDYWFFWPLGDGEGGYVIDAVKKSFIKANKV